MSALPNRSDLAGSPSKSTLQTILLSLYDAVAQRLAAGTTGAGTASAAELKTARDSLGLGAGADIASAATLDLTNRTGNIVRVTGTTAITAINMANGDQVLLTAAAAAQFNVSGVLVYTCNPGDSVLVWRGGDGVQRATVIPGNAGTPIQLGYIKGFTMSTAGSSTAMTIGVGQATDSSGTATIRLNSSVSKTTAAWAAGNGNGGLDTGSISANTWYHFYAIRRPDTGAVDVIFSLSASAPSLPANYTQYAFLESGKTNASSQWERFFDTGGYMLWETAFFQDVLVNNPGATAVLRALSVPFGREVSALIIGGLQNNSAGFDCHGLLTSPLVADRGPIHGFCNLNLTRNAASHSYVANAQMEVTTNTSSQIRTRVSASTIDVTLQITTLGWKKYGR